MMSAPSSISPGRCWTAGFLTALVFAAVPLLRHIADPYPDDYHGNLLAWYACLSENMETIGFAESAFLPALNLTAPREAQGEQFSYYLSHPFLDVVLRAATFRVLGAGEWQARLQGVVGCLMFSLVMFLILAHLVSRRAAFLGALSLSGLPMWAGIGHISMHHPLTLLFGSAAFLFLLRTRAQGNRSDRILVLTCLFVAMAIDWAGYFFAVLAWSVSFGSISALRSLRWWVPITVLGAVTAYGVHVAVFVGGIEGLGNMLVGALATGEFPGGFAFLKRVGAFLLAGYRLPTLIAVVIAGLVSLRDARRRIPWLLAAMLGFMNVAAFPTKAAVHDFWGCYWLPLTALSWAVVFDILLQGLPEAARRVAFALATLVFLGLPWTVDFNDAAIERGRVQTAAALNLKNLLPRDECVLLVSNYRGVDPLRMTALLRSYVHPVPVTTARELSQFPAQLKQAASRFSALSGIRVFLVVGGEKTEASGLAAAAAEHGRPHAAGIWEITRFAWAH